MHATVPVQRTLLTDKGWCARVLWASAVLPKNQGLSPSHAGGCVRPPQAIRAFTASFAAAAPIRCLATTTGTVKWFNVTKVRDGGDRGLARVNGDVMIAV